MSDVQDCKFSKNTLSLHSPGPVVTGLNLIKNMNYFLVSTNHLETRILFQDEEDFKAAMNYVAVVTSVTGVKVLAFVLMSNHVHFMLCCTRELANSFTVRFKTAYGRYFRNKYGTGNLMRRNTVDIKDVVSQYESLEKAIAYVQMNPVAARICLHSTGYRWSTGNVFFNLNREKGMPLSSLSVRAQQRLLKSEAQLPQNWTVGREGYVLQESYVSVNFVEKLFRTPARMNYFLNISSKARLIEGRNNPSFRDQIVQEACVDLCRTMFGSDSVEPLEKEEKKELLRQLKRRFCADINQLGRTTGLRPEEISRLFESF